MPIRRPRENNKIPSTALNFMSLIICRWISNLTAHFERVASSFNAARSHFSWSLTSAASGSVWSISPFLRRSNFHHLRLLKRNVLLQKRDPHFRLTSFASPPHNLEALLPSFECVTGNADLSSTIIDVLRLQDIGEEFMLVRNVAMCFCDVHLPLLCGEI